jgi:hypothetical protein
MKYFNTLPKIITSDNNSNGILLTNIMARASLIPEALKNPVLYYTYDIQEGDTPEIIAHKYYDDPYRYWIVLFANQITDPQWDWPMSSSVFEKYIIKKYTGTGINVYSSVHHFEKTDIQTDINTQTITRNTVTIGSDQFDELTSSETNTYTLPTGAVTVNVFSRAVSYYEYEDELNESKRNIKLLNKSYVDEFESELKRLMN